MVVVPMPKTLLLVWMVASSAACGSTSGHGTNGTEDASASRDGASKPDGGSNPEGATSPDGAHAKDAASDAGPDSAIVLTPFAYYVATDGEDTNPGTLEQPFATLGKAQSAMRASSTYKTTYVRAGTYTPGAAGGNCVWGNAAGSSIELTAADSGETWSAYPPDGFGTAMLDGQSTMGTSGTTGGNGAGCGFGASNAENVTIVGLGFENYRYSAIWAFAMTDFVVQDNLIEGTTSAAFGAASIIITASPGALVANNYVHDVAYMGIVIDDNSMTGGSMSDTTVENNVVLNSCTWPAVSGAGNDMNGGDCGAIYFWSMTSSISTGMQILNNYVRDVNASSSGMGDFGACCSLGIYLDDGVNNVTERGNVITGITTSCFMVHGGDDNVIEGNLCDIRTTGTESIVTYQNTGDTQMLGNVFENNIVVASSSGAGGGFAGISAPNPMTIKNNAYYNYVGKTLDTSGVGGAGNDSNPTYMDPQVSCWAPTVAKGSPVLGSPVDFAGIRAAWGPPTFVMPKTGTAPSWPHGC
jgi:hypothetical protein